MAELGEPRASFAAHCALLDLEPPPPASPGSELPPYADVVNIEVTTLLQRMFLHPAVLLTRKATRLYVARHSPQRSRHPRVGREDLHARLRPGR